ncbi:MAG TPA: hypothetical protein V6D50_22960 [Chroococcales cyanobacterium]
MAICINLTHEWICGLGILDDCFQLPIRLNITSDRVGFFGFDLLGLECQNPSIPKCAIHVLLRPKAI